MSDRELLELAAKAAGFGSSEGWFTWTESEYPRGSGKHGALWNGCGYMGTAELWNPLNDDGDALRLAVKLDMNVELNRVDGFTEVAYGYHDRLSVVVPHGDDPYAATRRAIVMAAAEIGKAMTKE